MNRIPETLRSDLALDAVEDVTFVQLTAEPFQYRDAVRFANGKQLLLQSVREGVRFTVLETFIGESETGQLREARTRTGPDREAQPGRIW
jgi:hypothetical protein